MTDHEIRRLRDELGASPAATLQEAAPVDIDRPEQLASYIDHTALKPGTREADIDRLCEEARRHGFATVCVNPSYVPQAAERLRDAAAGVCTVVGFPLGAAQTEVKAFETEEAVRAGADEVDMVINVGWLRSGRVERVEADVRAVVEAARSAGAGRKDARPVVTKVIIETALLDEREKVVACVLAEKAGADFVKTSTGFAAAGATEADVALMRRAVAGRLRVKAAGGIRSFETAVAMLRSGAARLGASASVALIEGVATEGSY